MIEDAAGRTEGQLYQLGNGDLALLFRPFDSGAEVSGAMDRLLQDSAPNRGSLRSLWLLPDEAMPVLHYVRTRAAEPPRPAPSLPTQRPGLVAAAGKLAQSMPLGDVVSRQTGVLLRPGHRQRVKPLFREVIASAAMLAGRIAATEHGEADPFLLGHFAAQLDRRLLTALAADIPAQGPLSGGLGENALHLNLTVSGVLSKEFAAFMTASEAAVGAGLRIAAEIPFGEAFADPKGFLLAQERLRLANMLLVLDGLGPQALAVLRPRELDPHLVKLTWSPALQASDPAFVKRVGADRIVLGRADDEAALVWGLGQGIQRFQGRCIDMMLAAERAKTCPSAASCTVRQCSERAAAIKSAERSGCGNLALLDAAAVAELTGVR